MKYTLKMQALPFKALAALLFLLVPASLLLVPLAAVSAQAPTPIQAKMSNTLISLSLANPSVNPGDSFDITMNISTDTPTRGMQAALHFNPKLVEIDGFTEGTFYKTWAQANNASTAVIPNPTPDNQNGIIPQFAITVLGGTNGTGPTGSGTLFTFHAKAKAGASGLADFSLDQVIVSNAGDAQGNASPLAGVKIQEAVLGVGVTTGIVQPTAYPLSQVATPTVGVEPTVVRRSTEQGSGSPLGIWVIVIPIVVAALLIGVFVLLNSRKKS
ncbi:MAG: cohesin domain-containing protein [Anaerolineales bacterium]